MRRRVGGEHAFFEILRQLDMVSFYEPNAKVRLVREGKVRCVALA